MQTWMSHPRDLQRRRYHRQSHNNAVFLPKQERHHDSIPSLIAQAAAEAATTLHALKTEFSRPEDRRQSRLGLPGTLSGVIRLFADSADRT